MEDDVDAFVMAKAAVDRLLTSPLREFAEVSTFLREQISRCRWAVLPLQVNPPAAAQGALALEILKNREDLKNLLVEINDQVSFETVAEERRILKSFGGGCHQKIGVAILEKPFGRLKALRGLTDQGEKLDLWTLENKNHWKFSKSEIWPLEKPRLFRRVTREADFSRAKNKNWWLARAEALPEGWTVPPETLVWTSGLDTWKKLAERGVWVNGSAEGLGEREAMSLEALAPEAAGDASWIKLSHGKAGGFSSRELLATYDLEEETIDVPAGKKCYFWTSGSAAEAAFKRRSELKEARHACGPGNTYQSLRKLIGDESEIGVYLSHEDWIKKVTGNPI
jgi:hydroxymethylbilane synthase